VLGLGGGGPPPGGGGAARDGGTRGTMDSVAILKHEVWICGDGLPGCCLEGPDGDGARRIFAEDGPASLVWTFEAGSHFEAMNRYHQYLSREPYTTDQPWDHEPYPEEWLRVQRGG
jgi:hypothetical protein